MAILNNSLFTSNSDEWLTPNNLFNYLNYHFKFTLDPCASHERVLCNKNYFIEDNGLNKNWRNEIVFCNPPYSKIKDWVKKCLDESLKGSIVVMLIPARTDTKYFHEYIMNNASIYFIEGRLNFSNKGSAPFPSMICIFDKSKEIKQISNIRKSQFKNYKN